MLTPTHVQVGVLRTKDLIPKGKNGTNDAYITFAFGKQKYQSSLKEKCSEKVLEWNEGCDIPILASDNNKSEVILKVYHKNSLGDKCLGRVVLPLSDFDVMAKPKPKWYPLKPKPGNEKDTKYRGEMEVRISFLIKPANSISTNDLATKKSKKESFRSSLGSILSLGKKKKKDKGEYNSGSSKDSLSSSKDSLKFGSTSSRINLNNNLPVINDDPGVISEEEDDAPLEMKIDSALRNSSISISASISDKLNNSPSSLPVTPKIAHRSGLQNTSRDPQDDRKNLELSTKSDQQAGGSPKSKKFLLPSVIVEDEVLPPSQNSYGVYTAPPSPEPTQRLTVSASMSNLMEGSSGKGGVRKTIKSMFVSSKHLSVDDVSRQNYGGSGHSSNNSVHSQAGKSHGFLKRSPSLRELKIPKETFKQYERKSKEELIAMILNLQQSVDQQKQKIGDLEDYIDKLLLRVLDNMPALLKNGSMRS